LNASQEAFVKLREPIHPGHGEDYTIALSWSPDDRLIASFGGDYRLNIWDSVTGEIYTNIAVPQDTGLYSIVWSADGSEVIYARSTGELVRVPAPQLPDPTPAPATVTP
jgi:WD40 repeat protein